MKKTIALGASVLVLSGCALPVPLQVASWALDGISVITTQKSLTDHGLSIVAQKDCAVWRGLVEGELCREAPDEFMIANEALGPEKSLGFKPVDGQPAEDDVEELANFDTAAGGEEPLDKRSTHNGLAANGSSEAVVPKKARTIVSLPVPHDKVRAVMAHALRASEVGNKARHSYAAPPVVHAVAAAPAPATVAKVKKPREIPNPVPVEAARTAKPKPTLKPVMVKVHKKPTPVKKRRILAKKADQRPTVKSTNAALTSRLPKAGIYFVIGSFRNHGNARSYRGQYSGLAPTVLAAKLDGGPIYRVVVGPIAAGKERKVHRSIFKAGMRSLHISGL